MAGKTGRNLVNNLFFVTVKIQAGEYEKSSDVLVYAPDEDAAYTRAMEGESHGSLEDGTAEWEGDKLVDMGWEFAYTAGSIKLVEREDHEAILRYMTPVNNADDTY
jgi:hypothetical protein